MSYSTKKFDERVIDLLRSGGIGFMPSDTLYGLSCMALNEQAVGRIRVLKGRDEHKPFIVLISNIEMLDLLSIDKNQTSTAQKYWPGAFTLICRAPLTPAWLQLGTQSLAVRIPDNNQLSQLIDKLGPIISTSANKQNQEPLTSCNDAIRLFGESLDFYVDVGQINTKPSTIAKNANGKLEVLRKGAVNIEE